MAQIDPRAGPEGGPAAPASPPGEAPRHSSGLLIREVGVFQLKMLLEGTRDVLLVPITLIAALLGLARGGARPERYLRRVFGLSRRFDRWLNLYGPASGPLGMGAAGGMDSYLERIEAVLVEQYRRGGITAHAKGMLDEALTSVASRGDRKLPPRPGA